MFAKYQNKAPSVLGGFVPSREGFFFFFFLPSYCDRCIKEEVGMTELGMGLSWVGCGGCRGCIAWVWSSGFCGFFFGDRCIKEEVNMAELGMV